MVHRGRSTALRVRRAALLLAIPGCLALAATTGGAHQPARTSAGPAAPTAAAEFADAAAPGSSAAFGQREGVADRSRYAQLKAAADERAGARSGVAARSGVVAARAAVLAPAGPAPAITTNTQGVSAGSSSPSDSNGAIGTGRYIETVNGGVGIYTTSLGRIGEFPDGDLGATDSFSSYGDPQIVWDPATKKFYYVMMEQLFDDGTWRLDIGFSKNAKPSNADSDFCHYYLVNTADPRLEPDFPKLGGTTKHALIGANFYDTSGGYTGAKVGWFKKPSPSALKKCPGTPARGWISGMPFTPVPSRAVDPSAAGYIVASSWSGGSALTIRTVTSGTTKPTIGAARSVSVPAYSVPANAKQPNGFKLDSLDSRLTQVQLAFDPRLNRAELWTSLTTFAGAGAGVAWYELNPAGQLDQSGLASDPNRYLFNGTVSSDRVYKSAKKKAFGSAMVLQATASGESSNPAVVVMSKRGAGAASALVTVATGQAHDDFTCFSPDVACRWGDYSSLSPSPIAPTTGSAGLVYGTNMLGGGSEWTTRNFVVQP